MPSARTACYKPSGTTAPSEGSFVSTNGNAAAASAPDPAPAVQPAPRPAQAARFSAEDLQEALEVIRQLDPPGVGCRDLRECLIRQLRHHQQQLALHKNGDKPVNGTAQVVQD